MDPATEARAAVDPFLDIDAFMAAAPAERQEMLNKAAGEISRTVEELNQVLAQATPRARCSAWHVLRDAMRRVLARVRPRGRS